MIDFYARDFLDSLEAVEEIKAYLASTEGDPITEQETKVIVNHLIILRSHCVAMELPLSVKQVERISQSFGEAQISRITIAGMLEELRERIDDELSSHVFYSIPQEKLLRFYKPSYHQIVASDPEKLETVSAHCSQLKSCEEIFGSETAAKFKSAKYDLIESVKCFVAGRNTACVFHLMRVLEIGLAALGAAFEVSMEHKNWDRVINEIEKKIREMGEDPKWKALPDWKDQREFYAQAASHFGVLKDAWRNYTNHARGSKYDDEEADNILRNVKMFMQKLSTRLSELKINAGGKSE